MKIFVYRLLVLSVLLFIPCIQSAIAADKVVVVPINTSRQGSPDRLWGEGRANASTLLHDVGIRGGHCTTDTGVNFALSVHLTQWGNAQAVCPKDSWVCSASEISDDTCPITLENSYWSYNCDGSSVPAGPPVTNTSLTGWLADAGIHNRGVAKLTDLTSLGAAANCISFRAWCCWR